jgi:membrane protease YdiL (CAAX protease family)
MKTRRLLPAQAVIVGVLITATASAWLWFATHQFANALLMVCPGIAFTLMLMLGSERVIERAQRWVDKRPLRVAIAPIGLLVLYVIYALGMGIADWRGAALMTVYLTTPFLIVSTRLEPVVILWIWLPIEFGLLRRLLITNQAFDIHYGFVQLIAVDVGLIAFAVWNRTPSIGYRFEWHRTIARTGIVNFLLFSMIAIPLGFAIRFIQFTFVPSKLLIAPAAFVGIFLFTALPEEFLFRGLIQNWIQRSTHKPAASLFLAAIIFGASHLNNGPPIPNYRYFLMASIAGMFYGRAWRSTGSLMSSSITHALVDTSWTVFFR